eukprot:COSAG01_NODE_2797_length_7056_cov_4.313641_4_plen_49_part_00
MFLVGAQVSGLAQVRIRRLGGERFKALRGLESLFRTTQGGRIVPEIGP